MLEGEAVSSRTARASAKKEIDDPAGKFLRPRSKIAHLELLAYASRANKIFAAVSRQSANFDRGGNGCFAKPARASGLFGRGCRPFCTPSKRTSCGPPLNSETYGR